MSWLLQTVLQWLWVYISSQTMCFSGNMPRSGISRSYDSSRRRQWQPTPVLLPGKSHGWRSLVGCSPWGRKGSDMTERLHFHFSLSHIGEGNGNPLQCSCLENPSDGGAWWAAISGVAQSRTQLKRLSSTSRWLCGKESACQCRRREFTIPGSGIFPGGRHSNPLQYSCLGNPIESGAWRDMVHRVTKSQIQLKHIAHRPFKTHLGASFVPCFCTPWLWLISSPFLGNFVLH